MQFIINNVLFMFDITKRNKDIMYSIKGLEVDITRT